MYKSLFFQRTRGDGAVRGQRPVLNLQQTWLQFIRYGAVNCENFKNRFLLKWKIENQLFAIEAERDKCANIEKREESQYTHDCNHETNVADLCVKERKIKIKNNYCV